MPQIYLLPDPTFLMWPKSRKLYLGILGFELSDPRRHQLHATSKKYIGDIMIVPFWGIYLVIKISK